MPNQASRVRFARLSLGVSPSMCPAACQKQLDMVLQWSPVSTLYMHNLLVCSVCWYTGS